MTAVEWVELEDFYGESLTNDQKRALKRTKASDAADDEDPENPWVRTL